MSNRDKLRDAIAAEATAVVAQNQPVNIAALALELSSRYPQSGITLDQICAEITSALREAQEVAQYARIGRATRDHGAQRPVEPRANQVRQAVDDAAQDATPRNRR